MSTWEYVMPLDVRQKKESSDFHWGNDQGPRPPKKDVSCESKENVVSSLSIQQKNDVIDFR